MNAAVVWVVSSVVATLAAGGLSPALAGRPAKCNLRIVRDVKNHLPRKYEALAACELRRADGSLDASVNCRPADGDVTDDETARAIDDAVRPFERTWEICGGDLPPLGHPCHEAINRPLFVGCPTGPLQQSDVMPANADTAVATIFASAVPIEDDGLRDCQARLAGEGFIFLRKRLGARMGCLRRLRRGKSDACPDRKELKKAERTRVRFDSRVRRDCTDAHVAGEAGLDFGPPCDRVSHASFRRNEDPGAPNSDARPALDVVLPCLIEAHAIAAERMAGIGFVDEESSAFENGVAAGDATETSASFVTSRVGTEASVDLVLATKRNLKGGRRVVSIAGRSTLGRMSRDTMVYGTTVDGLEPDTTYYYRFETGTDSSRIGTARTAPPIDVSRPIRLGWIANMDLYHSPFSLLDRVRLARPDAVLVTGDTVVTWDDRTGSPIGRDPTGAPAPFEQSDYDLEHLRSRVDPSLRNLLASTTVYAQLDDGEIWKDAAAGNPSADQRFLFGREAFRSHWPVRGTTDEPLYRSVRLGTAVEIFLLDARSHRSAKYTCCNEEAASGYVLDDEPDAVTCSVPWGIQPFTSTPCDAALGDPARTILGAAQLAWLEDGLRTSTAIFKLVHGPPLTDLVWDRFDRYTGYTAEREAVLEFIETEGIRNVIWLSSDAQILAVAPTRVDAVHRIPEIMAGAVGVDSFFAIAPDFIQDTIRTGIIPGLIGEIGAYELDRPHVGIVEVDPTAAPASIRFDFVDHGGAVVLSQTILADAP